MATVSKKEKIRTREIVFDAARELEVLRSEIKRYESIFDSARMIVGHELNRPLTSISGYLQLLDARFASESGEKERQYFMKAKKATEELQELVETFVQMLRFDRDSESGEELEDVDLYKLVEKLKDKYSKYPAGLDNAVDPELPVLFMRHGYLELALDNLISNAMKHGGSTGPVTVSASVQVDRRGISRKRLLIINVTDQGPGISESEVKAVFDPFYKGSSKTNVSGLGLGLALVKNVMSIMMGDIHIRSKPGAGATATITMPIHDENPDPYERIG